MTLRKKRLNMSFKTPTLLNTNNCFNCKADFVFWRGRFRHHCRCCGNNFCGNCVQNYCELPSIGIWNKVRTCDSCYQKYKDPEIEVQDLDNESNDIFFDSALIPLDGNEDVTSSFENINLNDVFQETDEEEENAQHASVKENLFLTEAQSVLVQDEVVGANLKTVAEASADDRQLAIALSLSRIENKILECTTSSETALMTEEEQIEVALRLSALEENAKKIVSSLGTTKTGTKDMDEDEELSLALAISKIENEDTQTLKQEAAKLKENCTQSGQVQCPICFEERLEYALIGCGHVVCGDCKPKLEECPICRAEIRGSIRVYITD